MLVYLISGIVIGIFLTIIFINPTYIFFKLKNSKRKLFLFRKKQQNILCLQVPTQKETKIELQNKLIELVGGDREKAERLVAKARFGDYGKSETYYWWKAIKKFEYKRR